MSLQNTETEEREHIVIKTKEYEHDTMVQVHHKKRDFGGSFCEAGFDLTDFGSSEVFEKVLEKHGLKSGYKRIDKAPDDDDRAWYAYTWSNSDVLLVTGNNPLTGKYSNPGRRDDEKGYASYIGIEGECEAVKELRQDLRAAAEHVKGENPEEREFI